MHSQKASARVIIIDMRALSKKIHAPFRALEIKAKALEVAIIFAHDIGLQYVVY